MAQQPVKYIAQLSNVCELGLIGPADASWWRQALSNEHVELVDVDGAAQLVVTGLDSRWAGRPFRDISVFIAARALYEPRMEGFFIVSAVNASRFIVFFEDKWFGLPYKYRRDIRIHLGNPWTYQIGDSTSPELTVEMAPRDASAEQASRTAVELTAPLFLPKRGHFSVGKWLQVKVTGDTSFFDFDPQRDRFEIGPVDERSVWSMLKLSEFCGQRWHIRRSGVHARTRTFKAPIEDR